MLRPQTIDVTTSSVAATMERVTTTVDGPVSRRERNKAEKQRRILAAARSLFAAKPFDEVTTQELSLIHI